MFSIHSSFSELVTFVNLIAPKNITPITSIDRSGFAKLVELTHTNVIYLNDKPKPLTTSTDNNNSKKLIPSNDTPTTIPTPPPLPSKMNPLPITPNWKNWSSIKPRAPKKPLIEPKFSQSQSGFHYLPIYLRDFTYILL